VADAALDVLRALTGLEVAAWTDILDDDGEVASAKWCRDLSERLGIVAVALSDISVAAA
jgi:hypothetical protein